MMRTIILLFAFISLGVSDNNCTAGLARTQFAKWETKCFNGVGLKIEMPTQSPDIKEGYSVKERANPNIASKLGYKKIDIRLNPVWKGSYNTEPYYLIDVSIARLDNQSYLKYKSGEHRIRSYDEFYDNYNTFHKEIQTYNKEKIPGYEGRDKDYLLIMRKDYRSANGDYVLCGASFYAGSDKYIPPEKEDIKAIERIFNSVKFIK